MTTSRSRDRTPHPRAGHEPSDAVMDERNETAGTGNTHPVSSRGRTPSVPPRWRRRLGGWGPSAMRHRPRPERSHRAGAVGGAQQLAEDIVARGERFWEGVWASTRHPRGWSLWSQPRKEVVYVLCVELVTIAAVVASV